MYEIAGGWALAVGDVCGKGVDAAVVTSLARYTLRAGGRAGTRSARSGGRATSSACCPGSG
uniref:SpoIIE family protein phosphatase n=1 Tax=Microbispora cellulosiformans TaxID=2614688 RepID=UPI001CD9DEBF